MNITVVQEDLMDKMTEPIGECALCSLEITIDRNLSPEVKRRLAIHAVIENYCRMWPHAKVDQLEDFIVDALEQLEEVSNENRTG